MPRTVSPEERAAVANPEMKVWGRLLVEGGLLEDVVGVNPLLSAKVVQDLDQVVQSATFVCRLLSGANCLSPYLSTGARSFVDGGPLLMEDRAIAFEIQVTLPGVLPTFAGWRKVFTGSIDTVDASPTGETVTVTCRDSMVTLLLTEIENVYTNADGQPAWGFDVAPNLIHTQMQSILDQAFIFTTGSPYPQDFQVLNVGSQTTSASAFHQERTNVLQALRDLGTGKNGWDVRGKWDLPTNGRDSFVLCYYQPDRAGGDATAVTYFFPTHNGSDPVYRKITKLSRSRIGVRTVAEVTPADDARVPVVTENTEAIALYGRRFEAVAEDKASHIDTPEEAGTLGEIIVTDLGRPKTGIELVAGFVWWLEINDLFVAITDGRTFDSDGIGQAGVAGSAIFSVTHSELSYALGKGSLALTGAARGGAAQASHWRKASEFEKENQRATYVGVGGAPPVGPARERAVWLPIAAP